MTMINKLEDKFLESLKAKPVRTIVIATLFLLFNYSGISDSKLGISTKIAWVFISLILLGIVIGVNSAISEDRDNEIILLKSMRESIAHDRELQRINLETVTRNQLNTIREQQESHLKEIELAEKNGKLIELRILENGLPLPRVPRDAADFELLAAEWLIAWGDEEVHVTKKTGDGGVDVQSLYCVSQVKFKSDAKVGRPEIQNLKGAAADYEECFVTFFAWANGYTREAIEWADRRGVGLFSFDVKDQKMKAVNAKGQDVISSLNNSWLENNQEANIEMLTLDLDEGKSSPSHEALARTSIPNIVESHFQVVTAFPNATVDLGANLEGANLANADLRDVNLSGRNLSLVDLRNADLTLTDLSHANLKGANLYGAKLFYADLSHANLEGANLTNADLTNADLTNASLNGAYLYDANLTNAYLTNADLTNARFLGANMKYTKTLGAKTKGAVMPNGRELR